MALPPGDCGAGHDGKLLLGSPVCLLKRKMNIPVNKKNLKIFLLFCVFVPPFRPHVVAWNLKKTTGCDIRSRDNLYIILNNNNYNNNQFSPFQT